MMSSLLYPLITFVLLVVCVAYWGATALYPSHFVCANVSVQSVINSVHHMQIQSIVFMSHCVLSFTSTVHGVSFSLKLVCV